MSKTVEQELAEADRIHSLAMKMKQQGDAESHRMLEQQVRQKRKRAIKRMGKRVKSSNSKAARI